MIENQTSLPVPTSMTGMSDSFGGLTTYRVTIVNNDVVGGHAPGNAANPPGRTSFVADQRDYWNSSADKAETLIRDFGLTPMASTDESITVYGQYPAGGANFDLIFNDARGVLTVDQFRGDNINVIAHPTAEQALEELQATYQDMTGSASTPDLSPYVSDLIHGSFYSDVRQGISWRPEVTAAVKQVYSDVLSRSPTDDEASRTSDNMANGSTLSQERAALAHGQEASGDLSQIISDVQGRTPGGSDDTWIQGQQSWLSGSGTMAGVRSSLAHYSGEDGLINTIFQRALGREAAATDISGNEDYLGDGGNLAQVIYNTMHSQEAYNYQSSVLRNKLVSEEVDNPTAYYDSRGNLTVGVGHLVVISDNIVYGQTISSQRDLELYQHDSDVALSKARQQADEAEVATSVFVVALADADLQLGDFVAKNPNTWSQIIDGDYNDAANSLNVGPWIDETPGRVHNMQAALRALPAKGT